MIRPTRPLPLSALAALPRVLVAVVATSPSGAVREGTRDRHRYGPARRRRAVFLDTDHSPRSLEVPARASWIASDPRK